MVNKCTINEVVVKNARKICLVSSAAFSLSSYVYGWMAPVAAALGCMADMADNNNYIDYKDRLEKAIEKALRRTEDSCPYASQKKIIAELSDQEIEIGNLGDLIHKTEAYRSNYCTNADSVEIVNRFDMHFRECVSEDDKLCKLFVLSMSIATLDKIKSIYTIICEEKEGIDSIHIEVLKTNMFLEKVKRGVIEFSHEASYVLAAMAVFLLAGVLSHNGYPHFWVYAGLISYSITSFLSFNAEKIEYPLKRNSITKETWGELFFRKIKQKHLMSIAINPLISVSCFLMLVWSTSDRKDSGFYCSILGIVSGSLLTQLIKISLRSSHTEGLLLK